MLFLDFNVQLLIVSPVGDELSNRIYLIGKHVAEGLSDSQSVRFP